MFVGSKIDAHKPADVETNDEKENGIIDRNEAMLKLQSKFQPRQRNSQGKKTDK